MYYIMFALGIFVALIMYRILSGKKGLSDYSYRIYGVIILAAIIGGLLGSRLFQIIYNLIKTGKTGSGITFMGGLVSAVAVFFIGYAVAVKFAPADKKQIFKRELKTIVNIAAPSVAIAHCLGRIGCTFAGCCYGKPTDKWFGIDFVEGINVKTDEWIYFGYKRIPTQLFEAIFLLAVFAVTLVVLLKTNGMLPVLIYMYAYSIFRFFIEFLRDDPERAVTGPLSPSQWQSIIMFLGAAAITTIILLKKYGFFSKKLTPPRHPDDLRNGNNEIDSHTDSRYNDESQQNDTQRKNEPAVKESDFDE